MADKTLTIVSNGSTKTKTFNRDRFASVRSMTATGSPLDNETTEIQVTVAGHSDISGIYTIDPSYSNGLSWAQQGGNGKILHSQNGQFTFEWILFDNSDGTPYTSWNGGLMSETAPKPWNSVGSLPSSITIEPAHKTIIVNRTAPVVTSDRKGESRPLLSKVVGGATAAYSLRDLNDKQGNNKVVRVRRESDNHERDFLAKEISNGTLESFVNSQVTAPLDIKALTSTGRDGNFLIAKAAYSLRSLGTRQATVDSAGDTDIDGDFYTPETLSNQDGSHFDVQVTDNQNFRVISDLVNDGANNFGEIEIVSNSNIKIGKQRITFDLVTNSGTSTFNSGTDTGIALVLRDSSDGGSTVLTLSEGSNSLEGEIFNITTDGSAIDHRIFFSARPNSAFDISISNLRIQHEGTGKYVCQVRRSSDDALKSFTADEITDGTLLSFVGTSGSDNGFVRTWYDQSVSDQAGNTPTGNHATQTTADNQPKIVSAGALETDSSGNPALVGDGTDDNLINSTLTNQLDSSDFLITAAYKDELRMGTTGALPRLYLTSSSMSYNTLNTVSYSTQTGRKILSFQVVGNTQEVFANGLSMGTASETQVDIGQSQFCVMQGGSAVSSKPLMEVLVYNSNQSANRTAIEANIGEHYSISGIPAFDNSVNGFVETWYDQSGNGNDATQGTISLQPKIVDNGVIETDRDGKVALNGLGAKFNLPAGAAMLSSDGTFSLFAVVDFGDQRTGSVTFNNVFIFRASSTGGASSDRKPQIYIKQAGGSLVSSTPSFTAGTASISVSNVTSMQLLTNIANPALSTGNNLLYADGTLQGSSNSSTDVNTTTTLKSSDIQIFTPTETSVTTFLSEVIYYPSDQSANRPAIEANIANQYGITLS